MEYNNNALVSRKLLIFLKSAKPTILHRVFEGVFELARAQAHRRALIGQNSDSAINRNIKIQLDASTSMLPPLYIASIYTHPMPPIRHRPSKETIIQEAITAHRTRHYGTPIRAIILYRIYPNTILKRINGIH